ncbi:MAG TPA: VOC family protein [Chloroflexota bacterium]|jgi:catechol 2,3-dioxygenase-like lactoylglutathione lyase family enzyme|nr:VOC family protein [Chloroflexota bacterium]
MSHAEQAVYGGHGTVNAPGTAVDGFSHIVLEVKDLERSEQFYQEVIGLDLMGRDLIAEPRPHSLLRLNTGQLIVLTQVAEPVPIRPNTSSIHHALLLTIDQYSQAQERFKAHGYDIGDTREQFRAKGEYSMDIWDPDGHRWQLQAFGEEQHMLIKPDAGVVDCGPADDFEVGSVTTFREGNFFLVRRPEGFLALSRWCRHANGLLSYQREHWRFYCAFHGATYNLEGDHTGHLANIPALRLNPVTIGDRGHVLVDTDVVHEREDGTPPCYTATCGLAASAS